MEVTSLGWSMGHSSKVEWSGMVEKRAKKYFLTKMCFQVHKYKKFNFSRFCKGGDPPLKCENSHLGATFFNNSLIDVFTEKQNKSLINLICITLTNLK